MPKLLQSQEKFRKAMLARDARTLRELTAAYRSAYKFIKRDAEKLLDRITRAQEAGESVSPFWLSQEQRYRSLLMQIQTRINGFSETAAGKIADAQADLIAMGGRDALALVAANFPPEIVATFDLLPARALDNLIGVLSDGSPLADLLGELGPQAQRMISQTLINGVAAGMPIRQMARQMNTALGGNLTRALTISRTESLRAYRESTLETYRANTDTVIGWRWSCSYSSRTCAACFGMDNTEHPLSESFASHPNCRCSAISITKSYRELGIPIDEPVRDYGDADKWIRSQSASVQQGILGKQGYAAYRDGKVTLQDFVGVRNDPRWGRTRYVRPIGEILGTERRRAA